MSLYGALFTGVSGLNAQSNAIGIISDNIANVNTIGYKHIETRFSSLVTREVVLTEHSPGGVLSSPYFANDQQGLLQATTNVTDLSITGDGMFVVNDQPNPAIGAKFLFTRAGQFTADKDGNLANAAGLFLQGYDIRDGNTPPPSASTFSNLSTVNVSNLSGTASATTSVELDFNLPSSATVVPPTSHSVTIQIFDSLGNPHDLDVTFTKTGTNAWSFAPSDPSISGVVTGTAAGAGTLTFASDGTPSAITVSTPFTVTGWTTGAADSAITLDMGTAGTTDGVTQFASDFTITKISQDGVRFGIFSGINISETGVITALFDNGQQREIYQLPLANFPNVNGLEHISGNAYQQTDRSGTFLLNLVGQGGVGQVTPSALEASTVDLATEFTNMIVTQRAYSASARVITTTDEMLEELIRIR